MRQCQAVMRLLLFFLVISSCVSSYKYLIYNPVFGYSHCYFLTKIADTLVEAGHNVTMLNIGLDSNVWKKQPKTLAKPINWIGSPKVHQIIIAGNHRAAYWKALNERTGTVATFNFLAEIFSMTCEELLEQKELLEELEREQFDAAILELFSFCSLGLMDHLGIKTIIGTFSATNSPLFRNYLGEPWFSVDQPARGNVKEAPGFFDRFEHLAFLLTEFYNYKKIAIAEDVVLRKKFGESYIGHEELISRVSFAFINSNPYLDFPQSHLRKNIPIGGITIDFNRNEKLDEKWEKILKEKERTIVISFGSVVKSKDMPLEYMKGLLKAIEAMPDITFIWKYEEPTTMGDHLPNLYLSPWVPQVALLADHRVKLFVTHGGLGSTTEIAYSGKPTIFIPVFADQFTNAVMIERHGGSITMKKENLVDPEKIFAIFTSILTDPLYEQNAKRLREMLLAQPERPQDLVVRYAEFAVRFGPITSLTPHGNELGHFRHYFLDVIATLTMFSIVIILSLLTLVRKCFPWKKSKLD